MRLFATVTPTACAAPSPARREMCIRDRSEGVVEAEPLAPGNGVSCRGEGRWRVMGAGVVGVGGKRVGRVCRLRGASIKLPQNAFALVVADGGEVAFWGLEGGICLLYTSRCV